MGVGPSAVTARKYKGSSSTRSKCNVKPKPKIISISSEDKEDEEDVQDSSYTAPEPMKVLTDIDEEANEEE